MSLVRAEDGLSWGRGEELAGVVLLVGVSSIGTVAEVSCWTVCVCVCVCVREGVRDRGETFMTLAMVEAISFVRCV